MEHRVAGIHAASIDVALTGEHGGRVGRTFSDAEVFEAAQASRHKKASDCIGWQTTDVRHKAIKIFKRDRIAILHRQHIVEKATLLPADLQPLFYEHADCPEEEKEFRDWHPPALRHGGCADEQSTEVGLLAVAPGNRPEQRIEGGRAKDSNKEMLEHTDIGVGCDREGA